jgi:selenide,water dikinase
LALAILGIPVGKLPAQMVRAIFSRRRIGLCASEHPVAEGNAIDCPEPVYGLAVVGSCRPENVRRNADARPGDVLILTKPIGVGIYSVAVKKGTLSAGAYAEMLATTTLLNRIDADLAHNENVHAMTDVSGFGLLGHALEMARASQLSLKIASTDLPFLSEAADLAKTGCVTGASDCTWARTRRRFARRVCPTATLPADGSTNPPVACCWRVQLSAP